MNIEKVKSRDGTMIAFEIAGQGPLLILVGGALCDRKARASGTPLAGLLASRFTVLSYDRRSRGDRGDRERVAERDQGRGLLGAHDPGQARHGKGVALGYAGPA